MDASKLDLRTAILHVVPQVALSEKASNAPTLSEEPVDLDATRKRFLEDKVRDTLNRRGRPVVEQEPGKAAEVVRTYLKSKKVGRDFIGMSAELASRLYDIQPGGSPAGVLLVAEATFATSDAIVVAKLDHEDGLRALVVQDEETGVTRVNIEYLRNLFITEKTRVFKLAVFAEADVTNHIAHGVLVDEQSGPSQVAAFFRQFFGCEYKERAQELTERFFKATTAFLNTIDDAETRATYELALLAELRSAATLLNPVAFATQYFLPEDRDAFVSTIQDFGVPARPVEKDLELIEPRMKRVSIETQKGVMVISSPEHFEDGTIKVSGSAGSAQVTIKDELRHIGSRGAPG